MYDNGMKTHSKGLDNLYTPEVGDNSDQGFYEENGKPKKVLDPNWEEFVDCI